MKGVFRRGRRLISELRLLGLRGTLFRVSFELRRRTGLNVLLKRPIPLDISRYVRSGVGVPVDAQEYRKFWEQRRHSFGIPKADVAAGVVTACVRDKAGLKRRAEEIADDHFCYFSKTVWPLPAEHRWYTNPEDGVFWPAEHSSRLLLRLAQYGDIKLVWEVGRFTWVMDLVRAWLVDKDERHLQTLWTLIEDFGGKNPLYIGPQWTSEQEVAIRALMLVYVQEVLADTPYLDGRKLQYLHALLHLHGQYLEHDLDYAESAIRNNHLIHGALGLYAVGHALPWLKQSEKWCRRAGRILQEAAIEQWYEDGGYVQPSHNYQRSAWHGMLWAKGIAESRGDEEILTVMRGQAAVSLDFFLAQMDPISGRLPNWGPNDGALIGAWSDCEYPDFRPLLQALACLAGRPLPFAPGPWDEELFWFFGADSIQLDRATPDHPSSAEFEVQGLNVIRSSEARFAVIRCGSVRSRYGMQADQLHVDLWQHGRNFTPDAGSFNYNRDLAVHNWFRGTSSHSTVIVGEQDQMVPLRTFKYLRCVKAAHQALDINGCPAILAVHQGYTRLPGQYAHARLLVDLAKGWAIVDRIWCLQPEEAEAQSIRLHWLFADGLCKEEAGGHWLEAAPAKMHISMCSVHPGRQGREEWVHGEDCSIEAWRSRYYNHREPVWAANLSLTEGSREAWFATVIQEHASSPELDVEALVLTGIAQQQDISLAPLKETSACMMTNLLAGHSS